MVNSNKDHIIEVNRFSLPSSAFLSDKSLLTLQDEAKLQAQVAEHCPNLMEDIEGYRQHLATHYYPPVIKRFRERYAVDITAKTVAGIATEVITPANGVAAKNRHKILINLHGGMFTFGGRYAGQMESIPIAALGEITVISVDYRKAPEHRYPAATEDVVAVYQALLADYSPENIGMYGCSAGAILAGQAVAALMRQQLPLPGAVGLISAAPFPLDGDSNHTVSAIQGGVPIALTDLQYFSEVEPDDPEAFPGLDDAVLRHFPPSVLISSTRDFVMSQMVTLHNRLITAGAISALHLWDGLAHAFIYLPDLPETDAASAVLVRFFDQHLNQSGKS